MKIFFNDPDVVTLRKKIKSVSSDELAKARPERQSKLTIILNDGKKAFLSCKFSSEEHLIIQWIKMTLTAKSTKDYLKCI